jgi:hypothetical protein
MTVKVLAGITGSIELSNRRFEQVFLRPYLLQACEIGLLAAQQAILSPPRQLVLELTDWLWPSGLDRLVIKMCSKLDHYGFSVTERFYHY